jgi:hypothetical protein
VLQHTLSHRALRRLIREEPDFAEFFSIYLVRQGPRDQLRLFDQSPNNWIGYHLVKALGYYLKDDLTTAAAESRQIANPFFPPGLMLDALIADRAGDRARATGHRHALSILSDLARPIPR